MFLGPGDQPSSVVVSGANVSSTVTFASGGSLTAPLPSFVITNDDVALEDVERYSLSISNPSVTQNVVAAGSTDIDITDDDSKCHYILYCHCHYCIVIFYFCYF